MNKTEIVEAIGQKFGVKPHSILLRTVNRAIRTLPGGSETLDALEAVNAARNHAHRAGKHDRLIGIDAAIDRLEEIRSAMERHVMEAIEQ